MPSGPSFGGWNPWGSALTLRFLRSPSNCPAHPLLLGPRMTGSGGRGLGGWGGEARSLQGFVSLRSTLVPVTSGGVNSGGPYLAE